MGIKNLHKFLKKHAENQYEIVHLSHLAYKKIAIDTSLYMYKYKIIYADKWLNAFVNLVVTLREYNIHCIFIYDNGCPEEKLKEREKRSKNKENLETKACELETEIEQYHMTNEVSERLQKLHDSCVDKKVSLLQTKKKKLFDIKLVENELKKIQSQIVRVTKQDFDLTKSLFDIMGIPFQNAVLEGETTCAQLCLEGKVDAVLTEDTDVLAYNTPLFFTKLNLSNDTVTVLKIENILEEIEMTYQQFRDLCIMSGTDYNDNIPLIGIEKAYKLLKQHESIEGIAENTDKDITVLNHDRVRELFSFDTESEIEVKYCETPDFEKLQQFLFTNNCKIDINRIRKSSQNVLSFE